MNTIMLSRAVTKNPVFRCAKHLFHLCLLCIAMLGPLTACAEEDMKTFNWKEEVKLSNGQIIVAEQTETYRTEKAALRIGALFNNYIIQATFPAPISTTVLWEGHLKPLAIDMTADGKIYLVTITQTQQGAREYSVPDGLRHVAFKYGGAGKWERIPVELVPQEIKPNLLVNMGELFIKQGHPTNTLINLSLKKKVDSDPRIDKSYRGWPTK